ncbi:penicillin-binding protein activator [Acinetobacter sp.]|uniref:penicillin-binding protein activator n=1 Tax=Acinetobacter sp. TaxID=472 RepID=UPI003890E73A
MLNNKNNLMGFMRYCIFNHAQAEVLVILPESGPMARAGLSIKQGFMSAYQASGQKTPIKFVNSNKKQIAQRLKINVNKKNQMVIGSLAHNEVENLIKRKPKICVLALNEVTSLADNVWQFSLSKKDEAYALNKILQKDKIKQLYVFHQPGAEVESEFFLMSLVLQMDYPLTFVEEVPKKLNKKSSLLLLGNNQWINSLAKPTAKNAYIGANAIEQQQLIPKGGSFVMRRLYMIWYGRM